MLVFIDESGDPGFKIEKGSSPVFVTAMVIFDEVGDYRNITVAYHHLPKQVPQEPSNLLELEDMIDSCVLSALEEKHRLAFRQTLTSIEALPNTDEDGEPEVDVVNPFQEVYVAADLQKDQEEGG